MNHTPLLMLDVLAAERRKDLMGSASGRRRAARARKDAEVTIDLAAYEEAQHLGVRSRIHRALFA